MARFLHCHISTIYRVINYYCYHRDVNYGHDVGRPPALDSKQIKQLDRAIQKIFILTFSIHYNLPPICYLYISKKTSFDNTFDILDQKNHSQ
jgi:hypothetical protein